MLRLADELGGKIFIDGLDTTSMALSELRGRLALIPQEATMFAGLPASDPVDYDVVFTSLTSALL